MRRLIILLLPGLIIFFFSDTLNGQAKVDTIDISETMLEDRHIRYMYNFALNGALFQYQPGAIYFGDYPEVHRKQNYNIYIINNKALVNLGDLELFIESSDSSYHVNIAKDNGPGFKPTDFVSQYDIEFISFEIQDSGRITDKVQGEILHPSNAIFAIQFSDLYLYADKIYFTIKLYYYLSFEPEIFWGNTQFYEFEWCDSTQLVYPKRVSRAYFHAFDRGSNWGKWGGGIKIPSLDCP
ncbi:MAG: hypothetical protein EA411_00005 [Saprospirales bacterium]|nr:MAG: hypothetical protein EA411_00005 [Saprospirales bacterium]